MFALVSRRRLLRAGLAVGAATAFGAGLRLDGAAIDARILSAEEMAIVRAVAEAMFPGWPMPLDGVAAGVAEEVDRLVGDVMVEPHASGFRYVLRALEWGTLASRGVRFSQLTVEERTEVLDAWADPVMLPRRVAHDSLKLILGMAYFSHPAVLEHIGWRATCGGRS